jgi:hypothetical protein
VVDKNSQHVRDSFGQFKLYGTHHQKLAADWAKAHSAGILGLNLLDEQPKRPKRRRFRTIFG